MIDLEKGVILLGRSVGLWFFLSSVIALIPFFIFTFNSNADNMDTERLIEGINLFTEYAKWYAFSLTQLSSIIGTILINLGIELEKNRQPRY